MREDQIITLLSNHILSKYKTQANAAAAWKISEAFLSGVMRGNKRPNATMLQAIGFKRSVV